MVKPRTRRRTIGQRRSRQHQLRLTKPRLCRPQIGRVHTRNARQRLHIAVLRKQGHGGHRLARQHAFEVFTQGKAGAFQHTGRVIGAHFRALHKLLYSRLHRPQHQGRRAHAHHLQCTAGLVQLLARNAQWSGIQCRQVRLQRQLGIMDKTAQCLDCAVERFPQLIAHPGERTQILLALRRIVGKRIHGIINWHGFVPGCTEPIREG